MVVILSAVIFSMQVNNMCLFLPFVLFEIVSLLNQKIHTRYTIVILYLTGFCEYI